MIGTMSETFEETKEFNCGAFLGHGLRWPENEYPAKVNEYVTCPHLAQDDSCVTDNRPHLRKDNAEEFLEEQYYPEEYENLLKFIDTIEGPIAPLVPTGIFDLLKRPTREQPRILPFQRQAWSSCTDANKREQIFSLVAGEALEKEIFPDADSPCFEYHQFEDRTCEDLAMEAMKVAKALDTPVMPPPGFKSLVEEHLFGFGEAVKKPNDSCRKRRLCRHFVKGYCLRGVACDFLHDPSIFCSDAQKVFLGGLPLHLTPTSLKEKLEEQGLTVVNQPRILRGFTPQVCLGTVQEAEMLIARSYIIIDEQRVDVRPYQDQDRLRQALPRVVERSVFLGGLPENTTGDMIIKDLQRLDVKVVEYPVVKNGYAPRVVLGSVEHAKMLVDLKRVMVNSTVVDVRPFVNLRKRY